MKTTIAKTEYKTTTVKKLFALAFGVFLSVYVINTIIDLMAKASVGG